MNRIGETALRIMRPEKGEPSSGQILESRDLPGAVSVNSPTPGLSTTEMILPMEMESSADLTRGMANHPKGRICKNHWENKFIYLSYKFIYFIYFWLCWVFVAAHRLSLVVASGVYSLLRCAGFSLRWLLLLWNTGSRRAGCSSCGTRAQ